MLFSPAPPGVFHTGGTDTHTTERRPRAGGSAGRGCGSATAAGCGPCSAGAGYNTVVNFWQLYLTRACRGIVRPLFIASKWKGLGFGTNATHLPFALSHTYSEFANGTPRCIAAEHASKRFSSAGSPSTCAAWHVERHGIGRPLSDLAAAPQPSTPGPWALGSLRAGAAESRKGTAPRGQGSGLWHRQSRTFRARHHLDELAHELV